VTKDTKFHNFKVITEPCTLYSVHTNWTDSRSLYQRTNWLFYAREEEYVKLRKDFQIGISFFLWMEDFAGW